MIVYYNLFELKKFIVQIFDRSYYRLFQSLEDYFIIRILIMEKYCIVAIIKSKIILVWES